MKYQSITTKLSQKKMVVGAFIIGSTLCQVAFAEDIKFRMYGTWPGNNNGNDNIGVVKKSNINPGNVNQLKLLWHTLIPPNGQDIAVDSTPVLADGIVYNATWGGVLNAYDQKTGQLIWSIQLKDDKNANEAFDESPVLTKSKVFIAGRMMHAIDRTTGQELWKTIYDPAFSDLVPNTGFHIPSQLMIAGNNVVYGFAFTSESGNANGAP
jgi:outer membrane protein assembly factor BamB